MEDGALDCMKEVVTEHDTNFKIATAFDGSWQKKGRPSLNGVVIACSTDMWI